MTSAASPCTDLPYGLTIHTASYADAKSAYPTFTWPNAL